MIKELKKKEKEVELRSTVDQFPGVTFKTPTKEESGTSEVASLIRDGVAKLESDQKN